MLRNFLDFITLCLHITRRNWAVYRKDLLANTSPTVADPALIMISLGLGLGAYLTDVQGMSYMKYLAPGLTVATSLFTSFFETTYAFYLRMTFENVFKAMLTTPIGIKEVIVGELIWVGLKGAAMSLGVALFLWAFQLMDHPKLLPCLALVGFFVALACGAIGLIASACLRNINQFQTVYSFLIAPLYFLSGIFFPIDQMNYWVRLMAEFFPLIHGVRLAQAFFWNTNILGTLAFSGTILLVQSLILCTISYYTIRRKLIL